MERGRTDGMPAVFLDYACPFSDLVQRWLDGADVAFEPRGFSLAEAHRRPGEPAVWEAPPGRLEPSVIALVGQEIVRRRGDLDGYRRAMFSAWHEQAGGTVDDLWRLIERYAGGAVSEQEVAGGLAALAAAHRRAAAAGVFGTPTLVVGAAPGLFVKLVDLPPDAAAAASLWRHLREVASGHPELAEVKRAVAGG